MTRHTSHINGKYYTTPVDLDRLESLLQDFTMSYAQIGVRLGIKGDAAYRTTLRHFSDLWQQRSNYTHLSTDVRGPVCRVDLVLLVALLADPEATLQEIGKTLGVTRERVRQLGEQFHPELMEQRRARRQNAKVLRAQERERSWAEWHTHACYVCERSFQASHRTRFCSAACHLLWTRYFRYYTDPKVRYAHSRYVLSHSAGVESAIVRDARRIIKEFESTGTVTPLRRLPSNPVKAEALAQKIGIDLRATRDRLMKLEGIEWLPS